MAGLSVLTATLLVDFSLFDRIMSVSFCQLALLRQLTVGFLSVAKSAVQLFGRWHLVLGS